MYKGPKGKAQNPRPAAGQSQAQGGNAAAAAAPASNEPKKKRIHKALSSSDDEEETTAAAPAATPAKKAKSEAAVPAPAPVAVAAPAAAAPAAAFSAETSVKSLLVKKGSMSLKKLRKAMVKESTLEKEEATKLLVEALLDNASNITISWSAKADE